MSKTIEQLRLSVSQLEKDILKKIRDFEVEYGVSITEIELSRFGMKFYSKDNQTVSVKISVDVLN